MQPLVIALIALFAAQPALAAGSVAEAAEPPASAQLTPDAAEAGAEAGPDADAATPAAAPETGVIARDAVMEEAPVAGLVTYDAAEVDLDAFLWVKRPIVVFANTPADPAFTRQIEELQERGADFERRDVVLVIDTDPAARSDARQRLRPRGFMLAIIDKDGEVKQRRPAPRSAREIIQSIDKFPLRRQEILDELPSGRN